MTHDQVLYMLCQSWRDIVGYTIRGYISSLGSTVSTAEFVECCMASPSMGAVGSTPSAMCLQLLMLALPLAMASGTSSPSSVKGAELFVLWTDSGFGSDTAQGERIGTTASSLWCLYPILTAFPFRQGEDIRKWKT